MLANKNLSKITVVMISLCLIVCVLIVYLANIEHAKQTPQYQDKLFGNEIISLDIQADENDWQELINEAQTKEWISANVVINGEQFSNVGIRTKGNSSLSQVANSNSDRYSLQIKFNKYVKGQTYHGLDAFCVNNMSGDSTYMKDYISYDIMEYIGVQSPLTNYANVSVNGEHYSFGVALERYDKSYLSRAFNTSGGQLYSVKIAMGNRENFENIGINNANAPNAEALQGDARGNFPNIQQGDNGNIQNMRGGMGMGGNGGGSLIYTDDKISSYSAIFDNPVFSSTSDKDNERVITAIKNLNAGTDLEKYFDVDEILRYFAAHTVVVNLDSYTSNMQQNYYIYEKDGKISILPWDYGLAFGGFQSSNASSTVNFPIDTPVSGVNLEDRPLLNKLLEVDEYREKYHVYLQDIVKGYFESGLFEDTINTLDARINEYVKNDASAFSTYEQYTASLPVLIELGNLRAESIKGQLEGTIPSTTDGQKANSSSLIDASNINLSLLGSMGGGMRQNGQDREAGGFGVQGGDMFNRDTMQQAMQIITESGGQLTDEVRAQLTELGVTENQIAMFSETQNGRQGGISPNGNENGNWNQNSPRGGNMPTGNNASTPPTGNNSNTSNAIIVCTLLILLVGAIIFVAKPRKQ